MKTEIKQQPIGADEIEVIHPHNDALQVIDNKIQNLVDTHHHILSVRNSKGGAKETVHKSKGAFYIESEKEMKTVSDRLKSLENSRKLLWEFGSMQAINIETIKS